MQRRRLSANDGQILVLVAMTLLVLVGVAGLAIDSGIGYAVKAKLNPPGWHYALDGYVSILGTWSIWLFVGCILRKNSSG